MCFESVCVTEVHVEFYLNFDSWRPNQLSILRILYYNSQCISFNPVCLQYPGWAVATVFLCTLLSCLLFLDVDIYRNPRSGLPFVPAWTTHGDQETSHTHHESSLFFFFLWYVLKKKIDWKDKILKTFCMLVCCKNRFHANKEDIVNCVGWKHTPVQD